MLPRRSREPIGLFASGILTITVCQSVFSHFFPQDFLRTIELLGLASSLVGILLTIYTFRRSGHTLFAALLTLTIFGAFTFAAFYLPWLYFKASLGPNPVFP